MNCPKCGKAMRMEEGFGRQSNMHRGMEDAASRLRGWSCFNCGKWVDVIEEPVSKYEGRREQAIPKSARETVSIKAGIKKLNEYDKAVWAIRQDIEKWFSKNESIDQVVERLMKRRKTMKFSKRWIGALQRFRSGRLKILMEYTDG